MILAKRGPVVLTPDVLPFELILKPNHGLDHKSFYNR